MSQDDFEGQTDHDLLIVAVTELKHLNTHTAELAKEAKVNNGRVAKCEASIQVLTTEGEREQMPKRVSALERSMVRVLLVQTGIIAAAPFFIKEIRDKALEMVDFFP